MNAVWSAGSPDSASLALWPPSGALNPSGFGLETTSGQPCDFGEVLVFSKPRSPSW